MTLEHVMSVILFTVIMLLWKDFLDLLEREYGFLTMLTVSVTVLIFALMVYFLI
jgi:hypothetical protein